MRILTKTVTRITSKFEFKKGAFFLQFESPTKMTKSAKVKKNLNVRIVRAIDHHHLNARITRIDHFDRQACSAMSICESQIVMDIVQTLMTSI